MGIFDYFKKKHKQEKAVTEKDINKTTQTTTHTTQTENIYDGMIVEGELLKQVYPNNIYNGTFILPKHIKSISMFAFSDLQNLQTVIMHDGVRYIAPFVFKNCNNLTEVKGLENANTMKTVNGFNSCSDLKQITLPQSVTMIDEGAFTDCKDLKAINIPDNCWIISKHAFAGCENLQTIKIPASVEMIDTSAFAGCKNLTITFLDDDKRYLQDLIKEQDDIEKQYKDEIGNDFILEESEYFDEDKPRISDEEEKLLYDDMDIKYKKINIGGKEILWTAGKIIIGQDALAGVKEVIAYNQDTIQTIMKSGYKGKITFIDKEKQETITLDIPAMKNYQKELISKAREKYYRQSLIPSGGTLNWLINCEKRHYKCNGYTSNVVCDIPISSDSRMVVRDLLQPVSNISKYTNEYDEFCTSVTFFKKELDNHSIYAPQEYERSYNIYFPYGARFNEDMLIQIGTALSGLMDQARDLPNSSTSQEQLTKIQSTQKKLLDLFLTGTKNKNVVSEIMEDITLPVSTGKIREARYKKDWLPYFTEPLTETLFREFNELEEYRKAKNKDSDTLSKE